MSNPAPGYASHPDHQVKISAPEHAVTLRRGSSLVARTERAVLLEETGYPARYYLPMADFTDGMLASSDSQTYCPFKGEASYWHVDIDGEKLENAVWGYDSPYDECLGLRGYRGFYAEHFDMETKGS